MKVPRTTWIPLGLLVVWMIVDLLHVVDPLFLASPQDVALSLGAGLWQGGLFQDLIATVARAIGGFVVSALVGIPLGLLLGRIPPLAHATQPTIDFFRSIPATALFPLFLFFFGIGDTSKVAIVVYACSLVILVNTFYGAIQVKATRILSARIMGARWSNVFWNVVVPESAPGIFAGLRVALSLALALVIVTEMFIGTTVGLGYRIISCQMVYQIPEMYAGIFLAGLVGFLSNLALLRIEKQILHWVGK